MNHSNYSLNHLTFLKVGCNFPNRQILNLAIPPPLTPSLTPSITPPPPPSLAPSLTPPLTPPPRISGAWHRHHSWLCCPCGVQDPSI